MRIIIAVFVFFAVGSTALPGQQVSPDLDQLISLYGDEGYFNGALLIDDGAGNVSTAAAGLAVREWNIANTATTRFRIGSVAKVFTAIVVLQLHEEGQIDLAAPISNYLDTLTYPDAERITVHHLLSHTSGLPRDFFRLNIENTSRDYTTRDLLELVNGLDGVAFEPGTDGSYSNINYVILAAIIEATTGQTWQQNIRQRIIEPLGMDHTVFDQRGAIIPERAMGYYFAHGVFVKSPEPNMSFDIGGGGIYSTVGDLHRLARAMLDDSLLGAESRAAMFTQYDEVQGYAWRLWERPQGYPESAGMIVHHRGRIDGFTSQLTIDLDTGRIVVLLNNIMDGKRWQFTRRLMLGMAGEEIDPAPRDQIRLIGQTLLAEGRDAAEVLARELIADHPDLMTGEGNLELSGTPLEDGLNGFGFALLEGGRFDEAISVFLLNHDLFPDTANARIAVGYAYAMAGDFDAARPWVELTREVQPDNANADEVEGMIAAGEHPL